MIHRFIYLLVVAILVVSCNYVSSDKVNLKFLENYLLAEMLTKEQVALKNGFELGEVWNYKGYEKGNVFSRRGNYEFIYYDTNKNEWVGFVTNNTNTIERILNDVSEDTNFENIDGKYYKSGISMVWKKTRVHGESVMLFVVRKDSSK